MLAQADDQWRISAGGQNYVWLVLVNHQNRESAVQAVDYFGECGNQIAGALKVHTPPSKGQQFTAMSPNGDWQQAVALPMTWSDHNKSPSSKGDENVLTYGNVTATIRDDLCEVVVGVASLSVTSAAVTIEVGGVSVEVSSSGVAITGGKVTHDGKNIGSSHIHGGVVSGGDLTDVPAN